MKPHRQHPQWNGHILERRTTGFRVPHVRLDYLETRSRGDPSEELDGGLADLVRGIQAWRRLYAKIHAEYPSWDDVQIKTRVHEMLKAECKDPRCWCRIGGYYSGRHFRGTPLR